MDIAMQNIAMPYGYDPYMGTQINMEPTYQSDPLATLFTSAEATPLPQQQPTYHAVQHQQPQPFQPSFVANDITATTPPAAQATNWNALQSTPYPIQHQQQSQLSSANASYPEYQHYRAHYAQSCKQYYEQQDQQLHNAYVAPITPEAPKLANAQPESMPVHQQNDRNVDIKGGNSILRLMLSQPKGRTIGYRSDYDINSLSTAPSVMKPQRIMCDAVHNPSIYPSPQRSVDSPLDTSAASAASAATEAAATSITSVATGSASVPASVDGTFATPPQSPTQYQNNGEFCVFASFF